MKNNEIVMNGIEKLKPKTPMSKLALEVDRALDDKVDMLEVRIAIRRAIEIHKY